MTVVLFWWLRLQLEKFGGKSFIIILNININIIRYRINESKFETILQNLPGEPDNIKRSRDQSRETYWVGLYTGRNSHFPDPLLDFTFNYTLVRFILRLQRALGFVLEHIGIWSNCSTLQNVGSFIKHFHLISKSSNLYGLALEIDGTGEIVNSLHSPDGSTTGLSEVMELNPTNDDRESIRKFLIGSAFNEYLGLLELPKNVFITNKKKPFDTIKPTNIRIHDEATPQADIVPKEQKIENLEKKNLQQRQQKQEL